jgi:hypothetical protein
MSLLSLWRKAVLRHWKRELLGGVLIGALALFSELSGIVIPPRVYEVAAVLLIFYAMFLAWRDEYSARLKVEEHKRTEVARLQAELGKVQQELASQSPDLTFKIEYWGS